MTEQPPTTPTNGYLSVETRKIIPTLVITVLTAFGVSWWNTQMSQNDLRHRLEVQETKSEANAKSLADNASVMTQATVQLALIGQNQTNMFEQIKEIKAEQERIKNQLQGRR